jgi:transposase
VLTNISKSSLSRWKQNDGLIIKYDNRKNKNIEFISKITKLIFDNNPYSTINYIKNILNNKYKIKCSYNLLRVIIIKELKLSYKKIKYLNYTNEHKLKEQTLYFCNKIKENINKKILFVDEVGFNLRIKPMYGWSIKGKIQRIKNKLVSDNKKSVACCITTEGEIIRMENNKAFNKDIFILFLKKLNLEVNTFLVLDNVPFHHSNNVKQFLKDKNINVIYTPPYSPWFNPIENIFGIIKNKFRINKNISKSIDYINKDTIIKTINKTINNILNNIYL